jgi:predicted SnoaL-like aldol condensation-catalyzing enzyme
MKINVIFVGSMLAGATALMAQQPAVQANPTPGCSATPAQLEANKKVALAFFDNAVDKLTIVDPSYKQHNPAFKKRSEDNHTTDYEEFKAAFAGGGRGGFGGGRGRGAGNGPQPPQGNQLEIVTAECDIVSVIHKQYRQDPTADPGKFYEAFTFDTFRVKDGKLVEHWDNALINPPAPAGAGRGQ